MYRLIFIVCSFLICCSVARAQVSCLSAHSHNDYEQEKPFITAYEAGFGSIEADIWVRNGQLYVAHDQNKIDLSLTLEKMYIAPIVERFRANNGRAWKNSEGTFQLLIDLKSPAEPTLKILAEQLARYPEIFNPEVNPFAVRIAISGNRPEPADWSNYPNFICFDGELNRSYEADQLERILLFSDNLKNHTSWRGEGGLPEPDRQRLLQTIESVHRMGKKIRFWNAPDTPLAWKTFKDLRVDVINTDHIQALKNFLDSSSN